MTPEQRRQIAGRSYLLLMAIYLPLFLVFATSIMSGGNPSPIFQLSFGCIFVAAGLHLLYFRREMAQVNQDLVERYRWLRLFMARQYDPIFFIPIGIFFIPLGIFLIMDAVKRL